MEKKKKQKLLQTMSSLEMLSKDKQAFVDIIDEIASNNSGGNTSKYAPRYFTIDWSKADSNWEHVLWFGDMDTALNQSNAMLCIAASYKNNMGAIASYLTGDTYDDSNLSFSYMPLYLSEVILNAYGIDAKPGVQSFEDMINIMNTILFKSFGTQANLSMEGITEITEEEFYNFD